MKKLDTLYIIIYCVIRLFLYEVLSIKKRCERCQQPLITTGNVETAFDICYLKQILCFLDFIL